MAKALILFLSILFINTCYCQDSRFVGNWMACGFYGMNYYEIKKSQKVVWYTNGCTDRGTKHHGSWTSSGDTITITSEKSQKKFILKEGKLCYYDDEGKHGEAKNGIPRTRGFTIIGAINRCRKDRKRNFD